MPSVQPRPASHHPPAQTKAATKTKPPQKREGKTSKAAPRKKDQATTIHAHVGPVCITRMRQNRRSTARTAIIWRRQTLGASLQSLRMKTKTCARATPLSTASATLIPRRRSRRRFCFGRRRRRNGRHNRRTATVSRRIMLANTRQGLRVRHLVRRASDDKAQHQQKERKKLHRKRLMQLI